MVTFDGVFFNQVEHTSSGVTEPPRAPWLYSEAKLNQQILSLEPDTLVELIELDIGSQGGPVLHFHNMNIHGDGIIYWGHPIMTFVALPFATDGFEVSGSGKMPRPKIQLANVGGELITYMQLYDNLLGAKVTRWLVFAGNLVGHADPDATVWASKHIFYIERKVLHTLTGIEWELSAAVDIEGIKLPRFNYSAHTCQHIYRDPITCKWRGLPVVDEHNSPIIANTTYKGAHDYYQGYSVNSMVAGYNSSGVLGGYKCLVAVAGASVNNDLSNGTYWQKVLNRRGAWQADTSYAVGDFVYLASTAAAKRFFVCKTAHTSSATITAVNTTYWVADVCSQTLTGCKLRYGKSAQLPAMIFPTTERNPL
jgi:lambda family phage minor tail protein L